MRDQGPLREPHCRRILPALLPAAELLLRVLGLRLAHWQSVFCKTNACPVTQRVQSHGNGRRAEHGNVCWDIERGHWIA